MNQLSRDDVLHLAQLSALELSDEEIEGFKGELDAVLGYFDMLNEVDVSNIEPTYQVTGLSNVWREDEVVNYETTREELLARSPEQADSQVKVPKVL